MLYEGISRKIFRVCNVLLLGGLGFVCLLPMWNLLAISFSSRNVVEANMVKLWPLQPTLRSYQYILFNEDFYKSLLITLQRVGLGLGIQLVLTTLVAFPLSRPDTAFRGRKYYVGFFLITMVFNGGMIPTYLVVSQVKLVNTIWALVVPGAINMFYVLLMLNYFRGIPVEIEEAAIVDGASWFTTMVRIYLPLALPSIATIALYSMVDHWNAWFDGLIYMNTPDRYPLMTWLQFRIINFRITDLRPDQLAKDPTLVELTGRTIKSAAIIVCTMPILVAYPFLQRYFVTGLVLGSVKG